MSCPGARVTAVEKETQKHWFGEQTHAHTHTHTRVYTFTHTHTRTHTNTDTHTHTYHEYSWLPVVFSEFSVSFSYFWHRP